MTQAGMLSVPLRRHQLAYLTPAAWQGIVGHASQQQAGLRDALEYWAAQDLPLVVARQHVDAAAMVRLGLPLPEAWGRQRVPLQVAMADIDRRAAFPTLSHLVAHDRHGVPAADWQRLIQALADGGAQARVYGSFGWQTLSGLAYLHARSDLDLLVEVRAAAMADTLATALLACQPGLPRLDGEFLFPDGSAVAWREWMAWRAGHTDRILRKHLDRVEMASDATWLDDVTALRAGVPA